ncbi:MAG: hypothetical protein ACK4VY_07315 [Brevundimonas sp.]
MADGSHIHDPDTGPGEGRWHAPDEVWAAVRTDYLAGMSAPEACRRYGVGLSALRARAAREGWRRADQPWTPPNRLDPDDEGAELEARVDGVLDRVDLPDLVWVAYRRMLRAVVRGQAVEALRWRRVHAAMVDEQAETERFFEQEDVIRQARVDADAVDASDASDGVFSEEA